MSRKSAFGISFVTGYAVARHQQRERAAEQARAEADEVAWQQAYEQLEREQQAVADDAAAAARDEVRRQADIQRRDLWARTDPVGQAWREVTRPGLVDRRMAERVSATNVAWRRAWTRQCVEDGLEPLEPAPVAGATWVKFLALATPLLLGVALVVFATSSVAWLWNHSWATPVEVNAESRDGRTEALRGTREFWTSGLAHLAYACFGVAMACLLAKIVLDIRLRRAYSLAAESASCDNAARRQQRIERYGFDPLASRMPAHAHWAELPDGSDPESALAVMTVEDPKQVRDYSRMTMEHVQRLQVIAQWNGRVRSDTPPDLPSGMTLGLERLRG